jgi:dynein heavy chain 2
VYYHKLKPALDGHPTYGADPQIKKLAGTMLEIYDTLSQAFSADDHRHYKLTPRHLTEWVDGVQVI